MSGPAGPPQVGVSALGYPSGLAGLFESSAHIHEQMSSSIATVVVQASSPSSSLAAAPYQQQLASRQPPTAATETATAEGLTVIPVLGWIDRMRFGGVHVYSRLGL